jgi:GMP synthase-like glutamine amidotransferase
MLCYIDIEHESVLADPEQRDRHLSLRLKEKLRFEALSSMPCLLLRYHFVGQGWIDTLRPTAVLISGAQSDWSLYEPGAFQTLVNLVLNWQGPMIGFCGGHQIIAHAYGAPTGPIGRLAPGEPDPRPDYGPGLIKELGVQEIERVGDDPLFANLPRCLRAVEDHYWEVKQLPPDFEWLARSELCAIQAFRHRYRLLYGTQFHPERYEENHPHGRQILANFFELARLSLEDGSTFNVQG